MPFSITGWFRKFIAPEGGKIDKTIKNIATSSQEIVQTEKALEALACVRGPELSKLAQDLNDNTKHSDLTQAEDITAKFLAPIDALDKPVMSEISIYKGIVRRLASMPSTPNPGEKNEQRVGVIGGKDHRVLDVIIGESAQAVLLNEEVQERWTKLGINVLGLVVWECVDTPSKFEDDLVELACSVGTATILFMAFDGNPYPQVWDVQCSHVESKPVIESFKTVGLNTNSARQKGDDFLVSYASKLNVSMIDQVGVLKTVELYAVNKETVVTVCGESNARVLLNV